MTKNRRISDAVIVGIGERLFFFARSKVRNSDVARDLTQVTITALIELVNSERVRKTEHIAALAYRILKNKIADHFKAEARRIKGQVSLDEEFPGDYRDPLELLLQETERLKIAGLLQKLDPLDRSILDQYYFESRSLEEIGLWLDLRPGFVALRKFRAINKIKKWLKEK